MEWTVFDQERRGDFCIFTYGEFKPREMFLTKLYRHSKMGFLIVIVFLFAFVYINYKWGVVATPIYQYGMYSAPFHIRDTQEVYLVRVNGKVVDCGKLSFADRDIVQLYLSNYEKQARVNEVVYRTMNKYLNFTRSIGADYSSKFCNNISDTVFTSWYRAKLEKIINKRVDSMSVYKVYYTWQENHLRAIDSPLKLTFIVP